MKYEEKRRYCFNLQMKFLNSASKREILSLLKAHQEYSRPWTDKPTLQKALEGLCNPDQGGLVADLRLSNLRAKKVKLLAKRQKKILGWR